MNESRHIKFWTLSNTPTCIRLEIDFRSSDRIYINAPIYLAHIKKGEAIPMQAWTAPYVSRSLRLPDFMIISTRKWEGFQSYAPAALPPGNIPGTHCCYRLSQPQGHSAAGRNMSLKNSNDTIVNRTRDLPACSAVPQTNAPPRQVTVLLTFGPVTFVQLCVLRPGKTVVRV
jgi:hypothetical protein